MSDKTTVIQVRLSEKIRDDFEEICKTIGINQPSVKVRQLIEQYVNEQYGLIHDRLIVHIYRPEGYDFGAWRVAMILRNPQESYYGDSPIPFALPELKKRRIASDKDYASVLGIPDEKNFVNYELGGVFHDGRWFGHLYSNGCPEEDNPTSIEDVRAALHKSVTTLFDRFAGARKA